MQFYYVMLLLISPAFIFMVHFVVARGLHPLFPKVSPLLIAALSIILTFLLVGTSAWNIYVRYLGGVRGWIAVIYGIITYFCLAFCYFQFFAMTETARRINILRVLYEEKSVPLRDLRARYGAEKMLKIRLERMCELNQLKLEGQHYKISKKLILRVGQIMKAWAKVLGFKP